MAKLSELVEKVAELLNDVDMVRWTQPEIAYWLNEGVKQIVILLPESNAITQEIQLVEGTKQSLPADGVRLIDVIRNTGLGGGVPSSPIRIIERDTLDTLRPSWHKDRPASVAKNFVFDQRNPKTFYVYPPSKTQFIEIVYSLEPTKITLTDDMGNFNIYSAALINYALHRAHSKDTEEASISKAQSYMSAFLNAIGLFDQADAKVRPSNYAPPKNSQTGATY